MKKLTSLRSRLMVGSILWTVGLVGVTNVVILGLLLHRFSNRWIHFASMSIVALGLLLAGLTQMRRILAPFRQLQERLSAVRTGREARVGGDYPKEVEPLLNDLNELLDHRARLVARAVAKAGDLAHGLKTPLAVLGQEAERLSARGDHEGAALVGQQVERMRRQIEYHLAHARAEAGGALPGASSALLESVDALVRTLTRLYEGKGLRIEASVPGSLAVAVVREDLEEMLGNLLDNACKWGRGRIAVNAELGDMGVVVRIDDDGPGIPADLRRHVIQRGVRADEAAPGSGLGLAIVADLADLYRGTLTLEEAPGGGTRAVLTLPAATPR